MYPYKPLGPLSRVTLYVLLVTQLLICFLSIPYQSHLVTLLPFGSVTLCLMYFSAMACGLTLYTSHFGKEPIEKRKWVHTMVTLLIYPLLYQWLISIRYLSFVYSQHKQKDPSNISVNFFANLSQFIVYFPVISILITIVLCSMLLTTRHARLLV